jgi:hypothetical protein
MIQSPCTNSQFFVRALLPSHLLGRDRSANGHMPRLNVAGCRGRIRTRDTEGRYCSSLTAKMKENNDALYSERK